MKTPLPVAALLLSLAAPSLAQTICVRGLVEKVPAISICLTRATHQFRCADLRLIASTALNLVQYEGQVIEACGTVSTVSTCRTMNVQTVTTAVDHLLISGVTGGKIPRGNIATFDLGVTPATFWILVFSSAKGWTELGSTGVLLIDPNLLVFASGLLDGGGKSSFPTQIPNDPSLINVNVHFQPVFLPRTSLAPVLGNSDCFQIQ